jgi:hypothetical protein
MTTHQFETPYQSYVELYGIDICDYCHWSKEHQDYYCTEEKQHSGKTPCLKLHQHVCPIANKRIK